MAGLALLWGCAGTAPLEPAPVVVQSDPAWTPELEQRRDALLAAGIRPVAKSNRLLYRDAVVRELATAAGEELAVEPGPDRAMLRLPGDLAFRVGSSSLSPEALALVQALGPVLADFELSLVQVTGHTDSTGSVAANRRVSLARAESVSTVLEAAGVDPARLVVEGRADSQPVADNATEEGRRSNRRVEIQVFVLLAPPEGEDAGSPEHGRAGQAEDVPAVSPIQKSKGEQI